MLQFPQPPSGHVTYAVFTVPSTCIPGGEVLVVETSSARDVATLVFPPDAFSFYFCDALPRDQVENGDVLRYETNIGPTFYIAREVISAEEMRTRLLAAGVLNTWKRFAVPAATPVLLNFSMIGATWLDMATPWLTSRLITPPMIEMNTRCSSF